MSLKAYILSFF
ncbi:uncharacterized protein FFMR_14294 [Fusarium fujikuroi]|nr:uncharacterized protein FFE2_01881 [Fusarium fujikuroi]SCO57138.1 uncharacterized protein FFMR_14294 [Fusarium fujikuroi]